MCPLPGLNRFIQRVIGIERQVRVDFSQALKFLRFGVAESVGRKALQP